MKNIYKGLIENLADERMDNIVAKNKRFRMAEKNLKEALGKYDKLSLPEADAKVVDNAINAISEQSRVYGELAYTLGMKDAVKLLKKIGVIGK